MAEKTVVSISIDGPVLDRITELADISKRSRSAYIEQVLRDHTEKQGEAIRAFQHPVLGPALAGAFANRDVLKAMAEVMGQELDDKQLLLFRKAMESFKPAAAKSRHERRAFVKKVRKRR